ncbi:ABC-type transport system involved in resistance to organic solvents, periplasmic component [Desulfocapsa sulfexigens DSM 10523]|uniref:ABC-type transport system involved in resistance to organic solvents, periplasmic component n=1 Tax=Desulfocapsa sulfexigens (strain DSM 10523 / SB164P1) TaxID=1167006 RepID=M1NHL6_DESSD|nr:outer membrane lipid asymmetry maintenance protein MlaD [Desulfocapsa sulfexigens]AGF79094.1 ABC-type transport system involved in resistance to organic solvents, periplasmic component [Desulfocapsa sulfexigens DSM 10523]
MKNSVEFLVGLFMIAGFTAFGYLALQLGEVSLFSDSKNYTIVAQFDNISGVKKGASVQVAGVVVGQVDKIWLDGTGVANIALKLSKDVELATDSMASVKSQGLIGDKFIALSLGGDEESFKDGDILTDTESAVDIESLISKFAFGDVK